MSCRRSIYPMKATCIKKIADKKSLRVFIFRTHVGMYRLDARFIKKFCRRDAQQIVSVPLSPVFAVEHQGNNRIFSVYLIPDLSSRLLADSRQVKYTASVSDFFPEP